MAVLDTTTDELDLYPLRWFLVHVHGRKRKNINISQLVMDVQSMYNKFTGSLLHICIESSPIWNNGAMVAKSIGYYQGAWEIAFQLASPGLQLHRVASRTWKSKVGKLSGLFRSQRKERLWHMCAC